MTQNQYKPDRVTPPGWNITTWMREQGMSQEEFAQRSGFSAKQIGLIVNGKAPITLDGATAFERVTGIPRAHWLKRDARYQSYLAEREEKEELTKYVEWVKQFPLSHMKKKGWIPNVNDVVETAKNVLQFFGIIDPSGWKPQYAEAANYRLSSLYNVEPVNVSTWIRRGRLLATEVDCERFDMELFKTTLSDIRNLTIRDVEVWGLELKRLCALCGVAVVLVERPPKTPANGAAYWIGKDKAVIQLSCRGNVNDIFWFDFFHEALHIAKHRKKGLYIHPEDTSLKDKYEKEADVFAANFIMPKKEYQAFVDRNEFTKVAIEGFADEIGIHPGCVLGRLQKEKRVTYMTTLNILKQKLDGLEFD